MRHFNKIILFTCAYGKGRECKVKTIVMDDARRKFSTEKEIMIDQLSMSNALIGAMRGSTKNLPRAIDRQLKIYGFMLLIEDTSKHTARVSRYRSWGSIELRKVYANCTWRVSQSSAGEGLCHDITRQVNSSSLHTLLVSELVREIIRKLHRPWF